MIDAVGKVCFPAAFLRDGGKLYCPMTDYLARGIRRRCTAKIPFPVCSAALKKDGERHPLNLLRKLKTAPSLHFPLVTLRSPSPCIFII